MDKKNDRAAGGSAAGNGGARHHHIQMHVLASMRGIRQVAMPLAGRACSQPEEHREDGVLAFVQERKKKKKKKRQADRKKTKKQEEGQTIKPQGESIDEWKQWHQAASDHEIDDHQT